MPSLSRFPPLSRFTPLVLPTDTPKSQGLLSQNFFPDVVPQARTPLRMNDNFLFYSSDGVVPGMARRCCGTQDRRLRALKGTEPVTRRYVRSE